MIVPLLETLLGLQSLLNTVTKQLSFFKISRSFNGLEEAGEIHVKIIMSFVKCWTYFKSKV